MTPDELQSMFLARALASIERQLKPRSIGKDAPIIEVQQIKLSEAEARALVAAIPGVEKGR